MCPVIANISVETEIEKIGTVVDGRALRENHGFTGILFTVDVSAGVGIACEGHSKDGELIVFEWHVEDSTYVGVEISVDVFVSRGAFAGTSFGGRFIDDVVDDIVSVGHQHVGRLRFGDEFAEANTEIIRISVD